MSSDQEQARSFGRASGVYEAGRPEYPAPAVEWMLHGGAARPGAAHPGTPEIAPRVADVGAGTGKLTRVLLELGADVVAVDPDAEMLAALRRHVPGVPTRVGTAEHLPLPDASLDAVVLGQAWHWVEPVAGSAEIGRVVRPGGILGLIWNIRDDSVAWVGRLTSIMHGSNAERMLGAGHPPIAAPFGALESKTWHRNRPVTRETLTAMVFSRSYVITAGSGERARIARECAALFDEIGAIGDAVVELPYVTHAYRALRS